MRDWHHHYQTTQVTCGPAVARMVVERRLGILLPERELATSFGTDQGGTRPTRLAQGLRDLGLEVVEHHEHSVDAMANALQSGDVVVCYNAAEAGVDHYAIVTAIGDEVTLCDPMFGPSWSLPRCCFESRMQHTCETPQAVGGWWIHIS